MLLNIIVIDNYVCDKLRDVGAEGDAPVKGDYRTEEKGYRVLEFVEKENLVLEDPVMRVEEVSRIKLVVDALRK